MIYSWTTPPATSVIQGKGEGNVPDEATYSMGVVISPPIVPVCGGWVLAWYIRKYGFVS